ncbi:MAG: RsmB/NOP family class I SAM-dependent RNA methyltransferase, partial [Treponema sp.]|nr:RsmB/NOP family class I SAM-dependent RNA methyltransferase [Treponema sp.]
MKEGGEIGFEKYYSEVFGERWAFLKNALLEKSLPIEFNSGNESYFLDIASVQAALALPLKKAKNILDLCAAPGGKTLVLANFMNEDALLFSNERSPKRRERLKKVIQNCLKENVRERVVVSGFDGAKMYKMKSNFFDAILLDAPCSSERHVIQDKKELAKWTSRRIKTNAITQWALLSSAYRMLKSGGFLLYSTCALCEEENDKIIERLQKKFDDVRVFNEDDVLKYDELKCEKLFCSSYVNPSKTKYGFSILPDVCNG